MTNSIILYGPARSGKTLNADAIAEHYGCTGIIDEWDRDQPMAPKGGGACGHHH